MTNPDNVGGLPNELGFEQWYVTNTFDYPSNPLGSRDCSIARKEWHAALEAVRNGEQRRDAGGLPELPFSPYIVSEWTGPEMTARKTWTAYSEELMRAYGEQCRAGSGEVTDEMVEAAYSAWQDAVRADRSMGNREAIRDALEAALLRKLQQGADYRYRVLEVGEVILEHDEYVNDYGQWAKVKPPFLGMAYMLNMRTVRRAASQGQEGGNG